MNSRLSPVDASAIFLVLSLLNDSPILLSDRSHVEQFDSGSSPWRLAEKREAGLDAWIVDEATNFDSIAQFLPSVLVDQMR